MHISLPKKNSSHSGRFVITAFHTDTKEIERKSNFSRRLSKILLIKTGIAMISLAEIPNQINGMPPGLTAGAPKIPKEVENDRTLSYLAGTIDLARP